MDRRRGRRGWTRSKRTQREHTSARLGGSATQRDASRAQSTHMRSAHAPRTSPPQMQPHVEAKPSQSPTWSICAIVMLPSVGARGSSIGLITELHALYDPCAAPDVMAMMIKLRFIRMAAMPRRRSPIVATSPSAARRSCSYACCSAEGAGNIGGRASHPHAWSSAASASSTSATSASAPRRPRALLGSSGLSGSARIKPMPVPA